ncbi:MAG: hypothetical protein ABIR79_11065 [Candidatus Binatia bacterium]
MAREIAAAMPDLGDSFGFECRLDSQIDVDFGIAIRRDGYGVQRCTANPAKIESHGPVWERIVRFMQGWQDPTSLLHRWIPLLFLEFDAWEAGTEVSPPSVFVSLDWPADEDGHAARALERQCLRAALGILLPTFDEEYADALESACESLPLAGRFVHVGAMIGRTDPALRLSASLPIEALGAYLRSQDADDRHVAIAAAIERFMPGATGVHLEHDVGRLATHGLGLVLTPAANDWSALFEALVVDGLATESKVRALATWSSRTPSDGPDQELLRSISHIKVVSRAGEPWRAKAYVQAIPRYEAR